MTDFTGKIGSFKTLPAIQNPKTAQSRSGDKKLEKACHQFESIFIKYMLHTMRETIPENNLFGGGQAEKIYTDMMDDKVAQSISKQRGIGLAAIMYAQMASMGDEEDNGK
jgi:peptidoglycan hydrolase FlgJ